MATASLETNTIVITVTEEDIEKGARNMPARCPVALALRRGGYSKITVLINRFSCYDPRNKAVICRPHPDELQKFIKDFDTKQPVSPTSFEV